MSPARASLSVIEEAPPRLHKAFRPPLVSPIFTARLSRGWVATASYLTARLVNRAYQRTGSCDFVVRLYVDDARRVSV